MLRTILATTDGSDLAEQALPYAEALARATGARLVLVRAVEAHGVPGADLADAQVRLVREAEAALGAVAARLTAAGVGAEVAVPYGPAAHAIVETSRARAGDLVVMATHGRSGLGRLLFGSTAQAVLAESPVPVLLVRAGADGAGAVRIAEQPRVLVPLDGSPFSEAILPAAVSLAGATHGALVLLRAVAASPSPLDPEEVVDALEHNARVEGEEYLSDVARRLAQQHGIPAAETIVRMADPAEAIVGEAAASGAALVAMATHGRGGLGSLVVGSVARAVLQHGRLPLLLVRPSGLT